MKYNSLELFLKDCSGHCCIYGAGVYGYYVIKHLFTDYKEQICVDSILVSSLKGNYNNIFGIPVKEISEINNLTDTYVVIAMSANLALEIEQELGRLGCLNTYTITEEEYKVMRREEPEVLSEIRQDIRHYTRQCSNDIKNEIKNEVKNEIRNKSKDIIQLGKYILKNCEYQKELIDFNSCVYRGRIRDEKRYKDDFEKIAKTSELLQKKIDRLVSGMDSDSIFEIYRIINRCHLLIENKPIIYASDERDRLREIEEEFYQKIFKLTDGLNCYKDYFLPKKWFESVVFFEEHGMRFLRSLEYVDGKDIIDAGGYIGDSALVLSKYTGGKVYSFEAESGNYELLKKTIALNHMGNVIPVKAALTDKVGLMEFHLAKNVEPNSSGSLLEESFSVMETGTEVVDGMTIDDYVEEHNLKIGLIKADVEGAESLLLKGAIETIKSQRPTMLISIYHNFNDFFEIKPWIEELDLGYRFKVFRPIHKASFFEETILICEVDE